MARRSGDCPVEGGLVMARRSYFTWLEAELSTFSCVPSTHCLAVAGSALPTAMPDPRVLRRELVPALAVSPERLGKGAERKASSPSPDVLIDANRAFTMPIRARSSVGLVVGMTLRAVRRARVSVATMPDRIARIFRGGAVGKIRRAIIETTPVQVARLGSGLRDRVGADESSRNEPVDVMGSQSAISVGQSHKGVPSTADARRQQSGRGQAMVWKPRSHASKVAHVVSAFVAGNRSPRLHLPILPKALTPVPLDLALAHRPDRPESLSLELSEMNLSAQRVGMDAERGSGLSEGQHGARSIHIGYSSDANRQTVALAKRDQFRSHPEPIPMLHRRSILWRRNGATTALLRFEFGDQSVVPLTADGGVLRAAAVAPVVLKALGEQLVADVLQLVGIKLGRSLSGVGSVVHDVTVYGIGYAVKSFVARSHHFAGAV